MFWCLFQCLLTSQAQESSLDQEAFDAFWNQVSQKLEHTSADSSKIVVIELLNSHCGSDKECLLNAMTAAVQKFEADFNLPLAIEICLETVDLCQENNWQLEEAYTRKNLSRYYGALGNGYERALHSDEAKNIYLDLGDTIAVNTLMWWELERQLEEENAPSTFDQMYALIESAKKSGFSENVKYFSQRLVWYNLNYKRYDEALILIEQIEEAGFPQKPERTDYGRLFAIAGGRGEIALFNNEPDTARYWFERLVQYAQDAPDHWHQANALVKLTHLELGRDDQQKADEYLGRAQQLAEELDLKGLLTQIYKIRVGIAESNGKHEEALEFLKKQHQYEEIWNFDKSKRESEQYRLQASSERNALEKAKVELELGLKQNELQNILVVVVFTLILLLGLAAAWFIQRKGRRELLRQNEVINKQKEELQNLDQAKSRFFANISHELRTPLTLIQGPVKKALESGGLSDEQSKLLKMADQNTQQLKELVSDILDLQKVQTSKMELMLRPISLTSFFKTLVSHFESLARQKQIKFEFNSTIDKNAVGMIDTIKCRQMLNNLLSNSFKYTPKNGKVTVDLDLDGDSIKLKVSDSGIGISEEDLPLIFDRFFQTNDLDKPAEGGTGIGLALCQEYVKLLDGKILVESKENEKTCFQLEWPIELTDKIPERIHEASAISSSEFEQSAIVIGENRPTILVVEDNYDLQKYISMLLVDQFDVLTANNGREALEQFAAGKRIDLVLSDLMMPVMNGYELLEKLKSDDKTRAIPAIMLTARAEASDKLKALRIGVDDYLLKPFDEEELLVRIKNLLQNKRVRNEESAKETDPIISLPSADRKWLEKFEAYVNSHLGDNVLSVPELASEFAMSESTLLRQLKKLTGLTTSQYLKEVRLMHARILLEQNNPRSMSAVASAAGFSDARSFSRSFKIRFGKLPSEIRQIPA